MSKQVDRQQAAVAWWRERHGGAKVVGGAFLLFIRDEHVLQIGEGNGGGVALNHLGGHVVAAIETANERQE